MNNLKRILCLALASVMVMAMMVVGASATSFEDDGDITHKTAVDTMVALGIINGMDPEHFEPKGFVTRAQMAQLIAKALNGGELPNYGLAGKGTFSDVPESHWGAEAIEYCASLGIVGGYGDGTFKPNQNVTGQEAAKMMLVALGYDADIFGFTGTKWATNVDAYASTLPLNAKPDGQDMVADKTTSLYDSLNGQRALPLTRDDAAQLIYNGLSACTVTSTITGIQAGAPAYKFNLFDKSLLEKTFKATVAYGTLTASKWDAKEGTYEYTLTGVTPSSAQSNIGTLESTVDVTEAYRGTVRVIYKETAKGVDVLAVSAVATAAGTNVIGDAEFKTKDGKTTLNGTELAASVAVYKFNEATAETNGLTKTDGNYAAFHSSYNEWDTFGVFTDEDGKIDEIIVYPTTVARIADVKNGVVTANSVNYTLEATKPEDVDATTEDELAKGDYILVCPAANLPTKLVKQAVLAEQTATAYDSITGIYTIGGQKYELVNDQEIKTSPANESQLGKDFNLVVVNGYVVIAALPDGETAPTMDLSSVLYAVKKGGIVSNLVDDMGTKADIQKVEALFTDGTSAIIDVAHLGATTSGSGATTTPTPVAATSNEVVADKLYSFKKNDNGTYSLMLLDPANEADDKLGFTNYAPAAQNTITAGGKIGKIRFDNDAVLFVKYKAKDSDTAWKVEVMTGAVVNAWKSNATVSTELFSKSNPATGLDTVGFGVISFASTLPGAESVSSYGYLVSNATAVYNPDAKATQNQITLWDGTENKTYYVKSTVTTSLTAGTAIEFTAEGNVITAIDTVLNLNARAVAAYDGSEIYFAGDNTGYSLSSAKIFYVDTTKVEGKTSGTIKLAENGAKNVYVKTASNKVAAIFVDVNNGVKGEAAKGWAEIKKLADGAYLGTDPQIGKVNTTTVSNEPAADMVYFVYTTPEDGKEVNAVLNVYKASDTSKSNSLVTVTLNGSDNTAGKHGFVIDICGTAGHIDVTSEELLAGDYVYEITFTGTSVTPITGNFTTTRTATTD